MAPESQSEKISVFNAENIVQNVVDRVTSEVENVSGNDVPDETQEVVMNGLKQRIINLTNMGKSVSRDDVIIMCYDMYRKKILNK
jgi:hypothetical protein